MNNYLQSAIAAFAICITQPAAHPANPLSQDANLSNTNTWLTDVTFNCVANDGNIYVSPRRIAGLLPYFEPADTKATWSNVTCTLSDAGTSRDDIIASLYKVNYWKPERVQFSELQGYRPGKCKLTVTVTNPDDNTQKFVKEFNVIVTNPDRSPIENGYLDGTIILNEEWFGHTNGSLNYITPDNRIIYQAYERENPGMSFGATSQYATIWADKLIVVSKQAADAGDPLPGGGRLVIADATTLKRIGSLDNLIAPGATRSADGRAVAGATPDKIYVTSSAGIFVVDITDPANPAVTACIDGTSTGIDLYSGQTGDIINAGRYAFAVMQSKGLIIIDTLTDQVTRIINDAYIQGVTQTADGTVWYTTNASGSSAFVPVNPDTLEEGTPVVLPSSIGTVVCGWGAWRSTAFHGCYDDNNIYFVTGGASIMGGASGDYYCFNPFIDDPETIHPFFSLTSVTGTTEFGETVNQMTYGTPRFDPRYNRLIVMAGRKGTASGGYRDHWIHFVDGNTAEVTNTFQLEPYYWFQSLPLFPDKHTAAITLDAVTIGLYAQPAEIDLTDFIYDPDNIDANISVEIQSTAARTATQAPAAYTLNGRILTVTPQAVGNHTLTLVAQSNGRRVTKNIPVTVDDSATGIDTSSQPLGAYVTVNGADITFSGLTGTTFHIFDQAGRIVDAFHVPSALHTVSASLSPGIYIIRGDNGTTLKTVIRR